MAQKVKTPDRHFDHATWDCVVQKGNVPKLTLDFGRDPMPSTKEPAKNHFLGTIMFLDTGRHMVNDEKGNRFTHSGTDQRSDLKIVVEGKYNVIRLAKWMASHNASGANTKHLATIPEWLHDFGREAPRAAHLSARLPEAELVASGKSVIAEPAAPAPVQEQLALTAEPAAEKPAILHDGHEEANASHVARLASSRLQKQSVKPEAEPVQLALQGDPIFARPSSFIRKTKPRAKGEAKSPLHANTDTLSGELWTEIATDPAKGKGQSK